MRVIAGQYFGISKGKNNWLYCYAKKVDDNLVSADVINGGWRFFLDMRTGEMTGDVVASDMFITYNGHYPKNMDYNAACDFMCVQADRNVLTRNAYNLYHGTIYNSKTFWKRLRKATKAFKSSWNGISPYNDSIPF